MGVFHRARKIHDGKQEKYKGLNKAHKNPHGHHGKRCKESARKNKKNGQNEFMPHHVSEKTKGEGKNAGKMTDDFNGKHNGNEPPDRAGEMMDIFDAVVFYPDEMRHEENNKGAGSRGVEACRRRKESGNEACKVADENIEENGADDGEKPAAFFTCGFHHEIFNARNGKFEKILHLSGDHSNALGGKVAHADEKNHDNPGIDYVGVCMGKMPKPDLFKYPSENKKRMFHLTRLLAGEKKNHGGNGRAKHGRNNDRESQNQPQGRNKFPEEQNKNQNTACNKADVILDQDGGNSHFTG